MDIATVVVVLVLIALSLGAIIWMEIHSRKTSSKELRSVARNSEIASNKSSIQEQKL